MTRIRFHWNGIGEFVLENPEVHENRSGEPFFCARYSYVVAGRTIPSNHVGDFPLMQATVIEPLPTQMELAKAA